jgi:hypothetical protein
MSSSGGRLIIAANNTGTTTVTGASTYTLVYPNGSKTWAGTLTVTQTDIAQTTPQASKIPIADSSGQLNGWVTGRITAMYAVANSGDVTSTGGWTDVVSSTATWAGTVMVWGAANAQASTGGACGIRLLLDGNVIGPEQNTSHIAATNELAALSIVGYASGQSSASHTLKLQVGTIGCNCTVSANRGYLMAQVISQ